MGNVTFFYAYSSFSENYWMHTSFTSFSENKAHVFRTRFKNPVVTEARVGEKEKQSVWFLGVNMKAVSVSNGESLFGLILCVCGALLSVSNTG